MDSWRVYQGVGHLADIVAKAALLLLVPAASQDAASGHAELHDAITLLHNGIAECRELLPHLTAYATQVFERPALGIDESLAAAEAHAARQGAAARPPG
jgi:hypothetical protein